MNPLDGNAAGNRTSMSATITGLSIADGATFWIRWTDLDISSNDDGLAVDDFALTPLGNGTSTRAALTLRKAIAWPKRSDPAELSLRGSFVTGTMGAEDVLDFSEALTFHVTDGLAMDETATLIAGECASPRWQNGRVYCISADRNVRASFKPLRRHSWRVHIPNSDAELGLHPAAGGSDHAYDRAAWYLPHGPLCQ